MINDNMLLWSHYSDCHRGVCLGFENHYRNKSWVMNFEEEFIFLNSLHLDFAPLYKITYDKMPKAYNIIDDDPLRIFDFFTHKSKDWEYEFETRLLMYYKWMPIEKGTIRQKLRFKKNILKEIIFGINSLKPEREKIINLVTENYINMGHDVKFRICERSMDEYKIIISDYKI